MTKSKSAYPPPDKATEDQIHKKLVYFPDTGGVEWNENAIHISRKGKRAGMLSEQGYYRISVNGKLLFAHRIAWFLYHGQWPLWEIDHIDGDRTNNKIENLRDVSKNINQWNRKARKSNTTGFVGVSFSKLHNKYRAQIQVRGKNKHVGLYMSPEEAYVAYCEKKRELHV